MEELKDFDLESLEKRVKRVAILLTRVNEFKEQV